MQSIPFRTYISIVTAMAMATLALTLLFAVMGVGSALAQSPTTRYVAPPSAGNDVGSLAGSARITTATSGWTEGVEWLSKQQVTNTTVSGRSNLVISYITPTDHPLNNRSWIYDDALAVISWSMEGKCQEAKNTLSAIAGLLDAKGKLGFSYNTADHWFDETYRTGAIAWIGYSLVFYQRHCDDDQFQNSAYNIAHWILTMLDPLTGSVKGGPDVKWFSTEHNIDAYFFLRDLGLLTRNNLFLKAANRIKQSLLNNHWNSSYGCFQQGIGDIEKVLDAASWGILFLLRLGESAKVASCLDFIEANFTTTITCNIGGVLQNVNGYKPNNNVDLVWSEGSLGVALAYRRAGNQAKHNELISEMWKMQGPNDGIIYACPPDIDNEFSNWESVAGTAWMVILQSDQEMIFWEVQEMAAPVMDLSKQADPSPVQDGAQLIYTIYVTNTGSMTLTATITDTLPKYVTHTGNLTWSPTVIVPGDTWAQQVTVTVQAEYTGPLVNVMAITTQEGATGKASVVVCVNICKTYLPMILEK